MSSRGLWHYMSARTRRSLALSWSALFVLSLLLQYFSFALAPATLAAHNEHLFELDGNAVDSAAAANEPDDDWDSTNHALDDFFAGAATEASANDTTYFTTGGSKDENDVPSWAITTNSVPDKDELTDAYAAVYNDAGGDTWVYFGADRFDNDGDAQIGFWFFQGNVGIANGDFTGKHVDGDVLILSEYTNGGVVDLVCAYEWDGSGGGANIQAAGNCDPATNGSNLNLVAAGAACDVADGTFDICAVTNAATATAPWTFTNKDGAHDFATGQFFEGGINLSDMFGGQPPCFGTFLAETRSSQETDAQLKDFAFGSLNTCVPPDIETTSSRATADFGQKVHDTADLSGDNGPVTGSVKFFLCGPDASKPDCANGGTQIGGAVTIANGQAVSDDYTVGVTAGASGWYCWRAEYTPSASSNYLAGEHTDTNTECFFVAPATIEIEKNANPVGPVNAGESIGFDIIVTNNGTQTTLGVNVSDNLPAGIVWTADAPTGSTTGLACAIDTAPSPDVLTCTKPSLAAGASFTVHLHGVTDSADCGTVDNTAHVATSNDGTDNNGASVVVQCPDVIVAKTPDNGTVQAGSNAVFTIVVTNSGPGVATGVTLTDNLPAGYTWSLGGADAASCSINTAPNPDVLSCTFGTLADDETRTITLTAPTTGQNCAVIPNTATVAATNEPSSATGNNSDNGSIDVLCANVGIVKTANPVGPVSAGDDIGFDITVTNSGDGIATGVSVSDPLPAGIVWTADAPSGDTAGVSCSIDTAPNPDVLTCTDGSMPAGASFKVHIHGTTDAADCGTVNNTATVSTSNDGGGSDDASVMVNCPDVHVDKTADKGTINAGETAGFTITVSNAGPGIARNVTLNDPLPAGIAWSDDSAACSIAANTLTCNFGDLAAGASVSVNVTGATDSADCHTLNNTATVAATNESQADQADNSDSASIVVQCADVHVDKTADKGTINAGEEAGFTITVSNAGPGVAKNVTLNDPLPAGIAWSDDSAACQIAANTLTCNFGDLASGASVSVNVTGDTEPANCGTLNNTATVASPSEAPADQTDNTDSASIVVNCPDLEVVKTADADPISAGDVAAFTIVVTNHGPGSALDVTVSDPLPAGINWAIDPTVAGCAITAGVLSCDLGTLLPGQAVAIHVSGETDAQDCHLLHNVVNVAASNENTDTDQFPNTDDADITVLCPAIVITKTADAATISAGDPIGFTITVTNTGAGNATSVLVTDNLPVGITWTADPVTGTAAASCSINTAPTPDVLTCTSAVMATGSSFSVHIHGVTTAADCGTVDNTATVTTGNDGGDDDSSEVMVECPDVTVDKTPDNGTVNAGSNAVFTIVVSNSNAVGTGTAHDVTLADNLPAGYTWSLGGADAADCSIDTAPNPDALSCDFGDLAPGETRTITLTAPTTGANCAVIPNVANVAASNESGQATGNNSDDASIDVLCAQIDIAKVANPAGPVSAGDDIGFDVTVSNNGDGTATGVSMTDPLPAGVIWTADAPTGDTDGVACSIDTAPNPDVLSCTDASMAAGDSFSVHLHGTTDAADCGLVSNTASVVTSNDGNDQATATVTVLCPDIEVIKDAPNTPIPVGQDLVFTIKVTNLGDGIARDVVLTDTLPAGFDWEVDDADCTITAGVLTCNFGDMDPDDSVTITLTAPTSSEGEGANIDCAESLTHEIPNLASASAGNEGQDVLENNSDDATIEVLCSALVIDKDVSGNTGGTFNDPEDATNPLNGLKQAKIGDTLTYTLHYTGAGPLTGAVITDPIPAGLEYVAGSASGDANFSAGVYDPATRTITWNQPDPAVELPDPVEGTVTFQVKVLAEAAEIGIVLNVATIDSNQTPPDDGEVPVGVLPPPEELTPPPTNTITPQTETSNPGFALMLILIGVAGLSLGIGFVTPTPARVRRRNRLG